MSREKLIDNEEHHTVIAIGKKNSGKSVFIEWACEQFKRYGRLVIDLFGVGLENAFWCVKKKRAYPILLIHPPTIELINKSKKYDIRGVPDTIDIQTICEQAISEDRVIVFGCGFYSREKDFMYKKIAQWIHTFPIVNDKLKMDSVFCIREAANLVFSYIKTNPNSSLTRPAFLEFIREARHKQTAIVMDTQYIEDIFSSIRRHRDRTVIKNIQHHSIPKEFYQTNELISELWRENPGIHLPNIPFLEKHEFIWLTGTDIFPHYDINPLPGFYHKEPGDDFLEIAGIEIVDLEIEREPDDSLLNKVEHYELEYLRKGMTFVCDKIYQRELEINGMRFSINKLAKKMGIDRATLDKYITK